MNNIQSQARLNQGWYSVLYVLYSKPSSVCPLITVKVGHLQWISDFWNIHNVPPPFTYQTHDLIIVIQTETFQRHRLSTNKQATRKKKRRGRQREKGENSSVVHLVDDILCTLSVISFSSARLDRISPLSLSLGWLLHWSPWRHLFPLSLLLLFSSLSFGCYFPETLWISYNPFFLPHLLSYFLISAWMWIQHLPLDKLSISLSICLSATTTPPPPISQCMSGPKAPWEKKNTRWNWKKIV